MKHAAKYRPHLPNMTDARWNEFVAIHGEDLKFDNLPPSPLQIERAKGAAGVFLKGALSPDSTTSKRIDADHKDLEQMERATAIVLANAMQENDEVVGWRKRNLPGGLLPLDARAVKEWIESRATAATITYLVRVEVPNGESGPLKIGEPIPKGKYAASGAAWDLELMIPNPDGAAALPIPVSHKSELGKLAVLQNRIEGIFRCWKAEATLFILTGEAPSYTALNLSGPNYMERTTPMGPFSRARYTLEFDSTVSPRRIYQLLLDHFGKLERRKKRQPISAETLRMVEFGLKYGENQAQAWSKANPKSKVLENKFFNQRVRNGLKYLMGYGVAWGDYVSELQTAPEPQKSKRADKPKRSKGRHAN